MAFFKCKMCGGSLEVAEGMNVCECEYCGTTQTIPKTRDDTAANIFNRANFLRSKCEFDKAQEIYEKIVNVDPNEAEAYWGIILCKYGIEYVEDPKTLKKIPTCHRTQLESVSSDPDYLSAIEHADAVQRSLYEKEAAEIDRLQKDILAIVRNEKPFDVFICYKETDDSGRRTQDSVIANDIYYQLTQNGFKVFYAAITLEDKLGQEYEPYIFAALNSAKAMLVIGTKPEYFDAVWVKNEWSRFLKIAKNDRSKLLIPCYKDMSAYDLPEEFSHLQAQDMGKIGFINDVVRGIKKVVAAPVEKQAPAPAAPVKAASSNVENLLKRGMLCLEDEQWTEANKFFEEVLNEDVEESRAYLGKMLAELNLSSEEKLNSYSKMIEKNSNFQKAMRFGDAAMKEKLENYNKQCIYNIAQGILTRNESEISDLENAITIFDGIADFSNAKDQIDKCREKIKEIKYSDAVSLFNSDSILNIESAIKIFEELGDYKDSAEMIDKCNEKINEIHYNNAIKNYNSDSIPDIESGAKLFKKLGDYKDSADMIDKCREKIEDIKRAEEEEERRREESRAKQAELARQARIRKKRNRKIVISVAILSIILIIAAVIYIVLVLIPEYNYNRGIEALEQGNYDEAIGVFQEFNDESKLNDAKRQKGEYLIEQGSYDEAIAIFQELNDEPKVKDTKYQKSEYLMTQRKYDEAIEIFKELKDYKDSQNQIIKSYYHSGKVSGLYEYCKDNGLSFEDTMKNNGLTNAFNEYREQFKKYTGRYYFPTPSYLKNETYIDININEDDWTFSLMKTHIYADGKKEIWDDCKYVFSFEQPEEYDGYDFSDEGKIKETDSHNVFEKR